jgi:hypothetical protein
MKISKRAALLTILFLLVFSSVSYAATTIKATVTVLPMPPCVVASSITSNFNGNSIKQGNYIWFSSRLKLGGPIKSRTEIDFTGQTITFTANSKTYNLLVPDAVVIIDPAAKVATTVFNGTDWITTVPASLSGNVFLSGLAFLVPAGGLPGGISPVVWSGTFSSTSNFNIQWEWSSAVYTSFSTNYNALGVKPVDDNKASSCQNSDPAGTPENYRKFVIGGGRCGGGSDYIGSNSATGSAVCGVCEKPEITIISPKDTYYNTNSVPLTFKVKGTVTLIEYSLDGAANVTITGNTTLTGLSDGYHTVIIYGVYCGGIEKEKVDFIVDTKPLIVTITSPKGGTCYNTEDVPLKFTTNEPVVWTAYSLDGAKNKTIKGDISLDGLTNGAHTIIVYAMDKFGNTVASSKVSFSYCYCRGDADDDKKVDLGDFNAVLRAYGSTPKSKNWNPKADLNGDGKVDASDMLIVLSNYGKSCR